MARINVEHKALTDQRFEMLGKLLGSNRHEALGRMLLVWHECQEQGSYVLPEKRLNIIMGTTRGSEFLIDSDLAERVEGGLRIKGTAGRIEWLQEKRETGKEYGHLGAKHGKKGGRPKKGVETGSRGFSKPGEGVSKTGSPGFQNPPPAPAPPPALTPPPEEDKTREPQSAASPPAAAPAEVRDPDHAEPPKARKQATGPHAEFIRIFEDAWFAKYLAKYPFVDGKDGSAVKWFRAQLGDNVVRFRDVVRTYLDDCSQFVTDSRHSMGLLRAQWARWAVPPPPGAVPFRGGGGNVMDSFRVTAEEFLRRGEHDAA